jgi:hypothetical protein
MDDDEGAVDINGSPVRVGTRVRVLKMSDEVLESLSPEDAEAVRSMEGGVFKVYEVDEWGGAWVKKKWKSEDGKSLSHSLGLGPNQMEVAADS